jgi:dTMP kinase
MARGKFIVIDGGEGSGKGTQIEHLKKLYPDALFTREPGGSPYAEDIRNLMLNSPLSKDASAETQFALVWGGRADHVWKKINPALERGQHVICDRFDTSTFAYQVYGQGGDHLKDLFMLIRKTFLKNCVPDLYLFLEVSPEEGARRVALRKGEVNHFDERKVEFHNRVREGYKEFQRLFSDVVKVVDANKPVEVVREQVVRIINDTLKK